MRKQKKHSAYLWKLSPNVFYYASPQRPIDAKRNAKIEVDRGNEVVRAIDARDRSSILSHVSMR